MDVNIIVIVIQILILFSQNKEKYLFSRATHVSLSIPLDALTQRVFLASFHATETGDIQISTPPNFLSTTVTTLVFYIRRAGTYKADFVGLHVNFVLCHWRFQWLYSEANITM